MPSHIDLVDMNFVRMAQDWARRMGSPDAEMNFVALKERLSFIRREKKLPESERSVAVLSRDLDNARQGLLSKAVESAGFSVWEVDYRHAYVSSTTEETITPQSLSHWLTYMCGLVAASENRSVLLVSGAFELAGPLKDFVTRQGSGTAVVVFFQRLLNKRWIDNKLLDGELEIDFVNLDRHARELLGADLRELARRSEAARQGSSLPL